MKTVAIFVVLIGIVALLFPYSRSTQVDDEVKQLASSYLILIKGVCPNASSVSKIKDRYLQSIPESKVDKRGWVNENFDPVFTAECLRLESKK